MTHSQNSEARPQLLEAARYLFENGHRIESIEKLKETVAQNPRNIQAINTLAEQLRKIGKDREASRHFQLSLECQPQNNGAIVGLAKIAASHGNFIIADQMLKEAHQRSPDATEVIFAWSTICARMGHFDQAEEMLQDVISSHMHPPATVFDKLGKVYAIRSVTLQEAARHEAEQYRSMENLIHLAEKMLKRALQQRPDERDTSYALARVYCLRLNLLGDNNGFPLAVDLLQNCIRSAPLALMPYEFLGHLFLGQNKPKDFHKILSQIPRASETIDHIRLLKLKAKGAFFYTPSKALDYARRAMQGETKHKGHKLNSSMAIIYIALASPSDPFLTWIRNVLHQTPSMDYSTLYDTSLRMRGQLNHIRNDPQRITEFDPNFFELLSFRTEPRCYRPFSPPTSTLLPTTRIS